MAWRLVGPRGERRLVKGIMKETVSEEIDRTAWRGRGRGATTWRGRRRQPLPTANRMELRNRRTEAGNNSETVFIVEE